MRVVVPLAGPDLVVNGVIRPLIDINGQPLIYSILKSRSWIREGLVQTQDFCFILREVEGLGILRDALQNWFPGAKFVTLSSLTSGALLSAVAGVAALAVRDEPVAIDLADIFFELKDSFSINIFQKYAAVVPYFHSNNRKYSYLLTDDKNTILFTREKNVISSSASAGVYFFAGSSIFLQAAANLLSLGDLHSVNGTHFVCPCINSLIANGRRALAIETTNVLSLSEQFHGNSD